MVGLEHSSVVGLETTLDKWSFSVETQLVSTRIEEGDEYISFYCNSFNEFISFVLMVSVINKVENESVGVFFE